MSQSSQLSQMSVSFCGEEMDLELAISKCFKEIQTHLNSTEEHLRLLAMLCDQDGDYQTCLDYNDHVEDSIDGMQDLFKELKSIMSQISLKPQDADEKIIYKAHKEKRKAEKEAAKVEAKTAKEALKDAEKSK